VGGGLRVYKVVDVLKLYFGKEMVKESVYLSDWIQYLIAQKSHAYSLLGGLIALSLGIITLMIWYIDKSNYLGAMLSFILIIFIAGCIFQLLKNSKSKLNRPKILLEKIMRNPNKIKVDDIRKEWYEEEGKMKKEANRVIWDSLAEATKYMIPSIFAGLFVISLTGQTVIDVLSFPNWLMILCLFLLLVILLWIVIFIFNSGKQHSEK